MNLSKAELHSLADGLFLDEPLAVDRCVEFVLSESRGYWHNRARAMMCRRLKHCPLSDTQSSQLADCITARLTAGNFTEQFKDQLRLVRRLDRRLLIERAQAAMANPKPYIRRYAEWILFCHHHRWQVPQ